jgi:ferredoxin
MSYIIGNLCVDVCDTACASVCPVDCINGPIYTDRRGEELDVMSEEDKKGLQLYINPEECILCGACIPECPVDAIYESEEDTISAEGNEESIHKNYEFYGQSWPGL